MLLIKPVPPIISDAFLIFGFFSDDASSPVKNRECMNA